MFSTDEKTLRKKNINMVNNRPELNVWKAHAMYTNAVA